MHRGPQGDSRLNDTYQTLVSAMRARGRTLVAFSGGVDSSLVLRIAHDALGDDCLAVIADSPSLARSELDAAKAVAAEIGAPLEAIRLSETDGEEYRRNMGLRCYHCRTELASAMKELARARGFATIADGANSDDLGDYRPGMVALSENGFWHPLIEFGLGKEAVRELARGLGLSVHDKPSTPCLSSRVAFGERITEEKLRMIEDGEEFLHRLGFSLVRVRYIGGDARIEVAREEVPRLSSEGTLQTVTEELRSLGFRGVSVAPEGYRQGSMNQPGA